MCPHIKVAELNTLSDGKGMRGITNVDIRQVALPVLWLYGSAISPARLFK